MNARRCLGIVLAISPTLLAAKGCHFGDADVPLGENAGGSVTARSGSGQGASSGATPQGGGGAGGEHAGAGGGPAGAAGESGDTLSYLTCGRAPQVDPALCSEPAQQGRYYFDPDSAYCLRSEFICGESTNNFASELDCQRACGSENYRADSACSVPPDVGPCKASMPRFFFDPRTGACERFEYGGCDGNANNFVTEQECLDACTPQSGPNLNQGAVVQAAGCEGFGEQISKAGDESDYVVQGSQLHRDIDYRCGCETLPEYVMVYQPTSPLALRLCHRTDNAVCETCSGGQWWDLSTAFQAAGTGEFRFVD